MSRAGLLAAVALVGALVLVASGCNEPPSAYCGRDTDCGAGERCADGVCTAIIAGDSAARDRPAAGEGHDDGARSPDYALPDGAVCTGNHDDRIERAEMPVSVGAKVRYTIGHGVTVDLKGTQVSGQTEWSLLAAAADDADTTSELLPVFSWAASSFPDATYASLLDQGLGTYGVFGVTAGALELQGIASQAPNETKLTYAQPIDMLRFPIVASGQFVTESDVTGTLKLVPIWIHEKYTVDLLGAGRLKIPSLTLEVLLVRVTVKQNPIVNPFLITTRTVFLFVAECYGIVGRVSLDGEPADLGAVKAGERWRLAF